MNHNLFRGYQQYVEHHRQTFSFATPPSYQEWNATFFGAITPSPTSSLSSYKCLMSPPSSSNNSILSPPLSSNDSSIMSPPPTSKNVEREDEDTGNSETDSNKMKRDRWTAKQTEVLVTMWKENYKELESSKQHSVWMRIKNKIDGLGNPKTLKQIKTKLRNMKDACKVSKDNNKNTGRSPRFCAHFDDFDEILGTRDFMNPPFATQIGLNEHGKDNADVQTAARNEGKNCISITH